MKFESLSILAFKSLGEQQLPIIQTLFDSKKEVETNPSHLIGLHLCFTPIFSLSILFFAAGHGKNSSHNRSHLLHLFMPKRKMMLLLMNAASTYDGMIF